MTASEARLSPWVPLRHRIFRALFVAQLASNLGTLMQTVAAAWLMGDLGGSPALVALVQTAIFLPVFIVGIPAGALADVVDRRTLLLATQFWMLLSALALAVLAFVDQVTPASLLGLTFALGLGAALNGPAWQAMQPDLVPSAEIPQAIALGAMSFNLGRAAGPAIGGFIVAAAGPGWVFLLNAASFVGVLAFVTIWRPAEVTTRAPAETLAGATRAGLRYAMHSALLQAVLVRVGLFALPAAALQALLPIVVRGPLALSSGAYGVLLGSFGVGAALAAVLRPRVQELVSSDRQIIGASIVVAATLLVQGFADQPWLVGVALFIGGFAWSTSFTTLTVSAQAALPSWVRARGLALFTLVLTGGLSLGSALWGALADSGLELAHVVAAAVLVLSTAAAARWRLDWPVGVDLTPVPGEDPSVALVPEPTDGPVLVTVHYVVPEDEVVEFAARMQAIEQHRRRTGAYRWGLFRDLAEPQEFIETFLVQSWAEHLRQHHRTTAASHALEQSLRPYLRAERTVGHFLATSSLGALAPLEPQPELRQLEEET